MGRYSPISPKFDTESFCHLKHYFKRVQLIDCLNWFELSTLDERAPSQSHLHNFVQSRRS